MVVRQERHGGPLCEMGVISEEPDGEPSAAVTPDEHDSCNIVDVECAKNGLSCYSKEEADVPAVKVCIRVRPLLPWEKTEGHEASLLHLGRSSQGQIAVLSPALGDDAPEGGDARIAKPFHFDGVFGPESSQDDVWDQAHLSGYVAKVVDGFNSTVFAYGQTGSGKTFSMEGYVYDQSGGQAAPSLDMRCPRAAIGNTSPHKLGIVPRSVQELFARLEKDYGQLGQAGSGHPAPEDNVCVKVSFLQIYKERIYDLLNPASVAVGSSFGVGRDGKKGGSDKNTGLRMRWDAAKGQFFVENLFEFDCTSADEALELYGIGVQNKKMATTSMNTASSRSHVVFVMTVVRRTKIDCFSSVVEPSGPGVAYSEVVSKLTLVDLAGSERGAAHTEVGAESGAARFKEAVNINQSLFVLRKVISALAKQTGNIRDMKHVPYRESKLTSLLQNSVGGNGHMLMLACLSPSDKYCEENLSTLKYASAAACIKNKPVRNLDPKDRIIEYLKQQLDAAHGYILRQTGSDALPEELQEIASRCPVSSGPMRQRGARRPGAHFRGGGGAGVAQLMRQSRRPQAQAAARQPSAAFSATANLLARCSAGKEISSHRSQSRVHKSARPSVDSNVGKLLSERVLPPLPPPMFHAESPAPQPERVLPSLSPPSRYFETPVEGCASSPSMYKSASTPSLRRAHVSSSISTSATEADKAELWAELEIEMVAAERHMMELREKMQRLLPDSSEDDPYGSPARCAAQIVLVN